MCVCVFIGTVARGDVYDDNVTLTDDVCGQWVGGHVL